MTEAARVLVTGANGFVGGHLRPTLEAALPGGDFLYVGRGVADAATWVESDITVAAEIEALVAAFRPNHVVHLAAQASVGASSAAAAATWTVNVGGTINLGTAIARHAPEAVVLNVSSAEVYGDSFRDGPVTEASPLRPTNVYGRTKVAAEACFADILPASAHLITVRPFNHTGVGQDERFVVPSFVAQVARIDAGSAAPVMSVGNIDVRRDFLDVADVVRAYADVVVAARTIPNRSVFNISSGRSLPVRSVLDMILTHTPKAVRIDVDPSRLRATDLPCVEGNAEAIRNAVGWTPRIPLAQTVRAMFDEFRSTLALTR